MRMTNDQAPMTNIYVTFFVGHWDLVIGHLIIEPAI
jgi:hypothetical protein